MQNIGFVFILKPFFDKLYSVEREKEKKEALLRHIGYFNTQPYMVGMIAGIVANMEKEIADGGQTAPVGDIARDINRVKSNMAGPLAAIGDAFFYGELRPVLSFLTMFTMVMFADKRAEYIILAPVISILVYNFIHLKTRIRLLYGGFKYSVTSMKTLAHFKSMSHSISFGVFLIAMAAFCLYLNVFSFSSEGRFFNSGYVDLFVYIAVFLFSFFASNKFGSLFSIFFVLSICVIISILGI
jgi:PTS system mannose-specific IID component